MGVRLRKRKLTDQSEQYYFDVYHKGQREYRTFKEPQLILRPGKDKATAKANKEVEKEATRVVAMLEGELAAGTYTFQKQASPAVQAEAPKSFLAYFRNEAEIRRLRRGCKSNTYSCFKHFERFIRAQYGPDLAFDQFTELVAHKFRAYLAKLVAVNLARKQGKQAGEVRGINNNCALIYFKRLKMVSAMAFKKGLLKEDAAFAVKGFDHHDPDRKFLLPEELVKLFNDWKADATDDLMKRAFMFGCATGLRWADLTGLTWGEIQDGSLNTLIRKSKGKRLNFVLDEFAILVAGKPGELTERVFPLTYSIYLNNKLDRWMYTNGINKKITWHCARHTFATLMLFKGEDISVVQKALAHSRLETTQLYTKILDRKLNAVTSGVMDFLRTSPQPTDD